MMRGMSDETLDGIEYSLRLMGNPEVMKRRKDYFVRVAADRERLASLPDEVLRSAITERRLWTVPGVFEHKNRDDMVEAVVFAMQSSSRTQWLATLGLDADGVGSDAPRS